MKVLLVDDDPNILEAVQLGFTIRWPDAVIVAAPDGQTALRRFREENPDIVILDLNLPDMTGFDVCKAIRTTSRVPIVMLTGRGGHVDVVRGLELGADDYITKPFNHLELLARVRAVVRRAGISPLGGAEAPFVLGPFKMDFGAHAVYFHEKQVPLTPLEYNLVFHLVKNYPKVVQHRTLLAKVWGREYVEELQYLKVHVGRIRSKFAAISEAPDVIVTDRGVGYRFSAPEDVSAAG